jgi:hypothetical protein
VGTPQEGKGAQEGEDLCAPLPMGSRRLNGAMPFSHLNDPEHWRERAKKARALAEDMADSVSKEKMLDLAANYEHLAKRAEDRRSGKNPET